jgi:protein HIRA/HIR1
VSLPLRRAARTGNELSYCSLSHVRLPSVPIDIAISGHMVGILTADADVRVFSATTGRLVAGPTTCSHLLDSDAAQPYDITRFAVYPNGAIAVVTAEPAAYALDPTSVWIPLITPFQSNRTALPSGPSGPLRDIETAVTGTTRWAQLAGATDKGKRPEWFDESATMGHLEMRMKGAECLGSLEEHEHWVVQYAYFVGVEGFSERADELVRDLLGPIGPARGLDGRASERDARRLVS